MPIDDVLMLTGAAGFIGSHLTDKLLQLGKRVIGVDNFSLGRRSNLTKALSHPGFTLIETDLTDWPGVREKLEGTLERETVSMVWHMAANSDIPAGRDNPDIDFQNTFMSTYHVLSLMQEFKIPNIAFPSTSAVYGEHSGPLAEETGPLMPISNYGAMKLASEAVISAAVESFVQQAWIFRFPNVVGSRSTHGIIFDFFKKLKRSPNVLEVLGDGTQKKPYMEVSELVEAMLYIVSNSSERRALFNIGPQDDGVTVRYIAEAVRAAVSPDAVIQYGSTGRGWVGDVPRFCYATRKLANLGWRPHRTSQQAIDHAIQALKDEHTLA